MIGGRGAAIRVAAVAIGLAAAGGASAQGGAPGRYEAFCATCHGAFGRGDGLTAAVMAVPMPDLTRLSAGNGGAFPMARVLARIDGRDVVVAHGSPMPIYGRAFAATGEAQVETPSGAVRATRAAVEIARWLETLQR